MLDVMIDLLTRALNIGYRVPASSKKGGVGLVARKDRRTHTATNLILGGFFASKFWHCSLWASWMGSRKASRVLSSDLPTRLSSPFFVGSETGRIINSQTGAML